MLITQMPTNWQPLSGVVAPVSPAAVAAPPYSAQPPSAQQGLPQSVAGVVGRKLKLTFA